MKNLAIFSLVFLFVTSAQSIVQLNNEVDVLPMLLEYLPKNPIILEAGAFDGVDTLEYMAFFEKNGYAVTVYCFEPIPELYKRTVANTFGKPHIHTYELALSDKNGRAEMCISEEPNKPGSIWQSNSLMQPYKHLEYAWWVSFKNKVEVDTITLDTWAEKNNVDHIDYLKLDIQGSELFVLKAAPKILKTVKAIMLEVEFVEAYKGQPLYREIKKWLEQEGFEMIASVGFNSENPHPAWFGDALFVRKELCK